MFADNQEMPQSNIAYFPKHQLLLLQFNDIFRGFHIYDESRSYDLELYFVSPELAITFEEIYSQIFLKISQYDNIFYGLLALGIIIISAHFHGDGK